MFDHHVSCFIDIVEEIVILQHGYPWQDSCHKLSIVEKIPLANSRCSNDVFFIPSFAMVRCCSQYILLFPKTFEQLHATWFVSLSPVIICIHCGIAKTFQGRPQSSELINQEKVVKHSQNQWIQMKYKGMSGLQKGTQMCVCVCVCIYIQRERERGREREREPK